MIRIRPLPLAVLVALLVPSSNAVCATEPPTPPPVPEAAGLPPDASAVGTRIVDAARRSNHAWDLLADLCDTVGSRVAGSPSYARAVDWALAEMKREGLQHVHREDVKVTPWVRGAEELTLLEPNGPRPLPLTALGRSVGTAPQGITASVLVVRDFAELDAAKEKVAGKIVLYDFPMREPRPGGNAYGEAVAYRWGGATHAAKYGAVAVLVRSVSTDRTRTPHTGTMGYADENVPRIPAAAITIEDSEMLHRLQDRGVPLKAHLVLGANEPKTPATDANVVGELTGRERPDQIVLIGGHLDSWDLGYGAHDDGAGVVMSLEVVRILEELNLRPRRTIRVVLFANEERGLDGGKAYLEAHRAELDRHVAAIESDSGGFRPTGFSIEGTPDAADHVEGWLPLFPIGSSLALRRGGSGADISTIVGQGVPGLGLGVEGAHYFDYHHSALDTPDKVDPAELNDALAAYTFMTWLLAESPETLPRKAPEPRGQP